MLHANRPGFEPIVVKAIFNQRLIGARLALEFEGITQLPQQFYFK